MRRVTRAAQTTPQRSFAPRRLDGRLDLQRQSQAHAAEQSKGNQLIIHQSPIPPLKPPHLLPDALPSVDPQQRRDVGGEDHREGLDGKGQCDVDERHEEEEQVERVLLPGGVWAIEMDFG